MTLPVVVVAREFYAIGDDKVEIHAISSAESYRVQAAVEAGSVEDATVLIVAFGTDTDPAEVREWCATTPPGIVEPLAARIGELSALDGSVLSKSGSAVVPGRG